MTAQEEELPVVLKPCPFCGGEAEFMRMGTRRQSCIVNCRSCGAAMESSDEYEKSGRWWNERTADALLAAKDAEIAALRADVERLDFMIGQQAWIQWLKRDDSILQCQVYTQDEDEEYRVLHSDKRFYNTPREALDAAIAQSKGGIPR